jgi:hypothetical protein
MRNTSVDQYLHDPGRDRRRRRTAMHHQLDMAPPRERTSWESPFTPRPTTPRSCSSRQRKRNSGGSLLDLLNGAWRGKCILMVRTPWHAVAGNGFTGRVAGSVAKVFLNIRRQLIVPHGVLDVDSAFGLETSGGAYFRTCGTARRQRSPGTGRTPSGNDSRLGSPTFSCRSIDAGSFESVAHQWGTSTPDAWDCLINRYRRAPIGAFNRQRDGLPRSGCIMTDGRRLKVVRRAPFWSDRVNSLAAFRLQRRRRHLLQRHAVVLGMRGGRFASHPRPCDGSGGDAVYLPLKKGGNEIVFAVTEYSGGWAFWARLDR